MLRTCSLGDLLHLRCSVHTVPACLLFLSPSQPVRDQCRLLEMRRVAVRLTSLHDVEGAGLSLVSHRVAGRTKQRAEVTLELRCVLEHGDNGGRVSVEHGRAFRVRLGPQHHEVGELGAPRAAAEAPAEAHRLRRRGHAARDSHGLVARCRVHDGRPFHACRSVCAK